MCTSEFCSFLPGFELVDYCWQAAARYVNPSILLPKAFGSDYAPLSGMLWKLSALCHGILSEERHQCNEKAFTLPKLHSSNFLKHVISAQTDPCLGRDLGVLVLW
jgi:hypothetical protein